MYPFFDLNSITVSDSYGNIKLYYQGGKHLVFSMQETILPRESDASADPVEASLRNISQNITVFVFGLLPLFFIPVTFVPFGYTKTLFVIVGVLVTLVFFSLTVLRSGKISIVAPLALAAFWLVALATSISSLLSGDMKDSFFGDDFGVHTGLFVVVMALVVTLPSAIGLTKTSIMRLYILLTGSALVLGLFHIIRLVTGPEVLSFGIFENLVNTPMGGWNDLGLFFGLSILLSLVALEQLPLTRSGRGLFSVVVAVSLCMLAVVNFFAVWIVLGLVSLMVLMYSLTKDRFAEKTLTLEGKKDVVSLQSIFLSVCVFVVSVVFIIGGGAVGGYISKYTGVSYVEVRPSFEATTDIARNVYQQNALVGIGPNKFTDAWRLYKDPSINQTVFWATDFPGASGYLTTLFVTTGVLGTLAWLLFFGLFLRTGLRMLFRSTHVDRFWYFIGSSSFVAALYLWGMSFIYVPGTAILLIAALFTGITFIANGALVPSRRISFSIVSNKRAGFALVGVVMVVIIGATSALYYVGQQYASVYSFGKSVTLLQNGTEVDQFEANIASIYASSKNESYALQLALYQYAKINELIGLEKLTQAQQQELQTSIYNAVTAAQIVVDKDPTDAVSWSTLGSILSVLAGAKVEGSEVRARETLATARKLDPTNPLYALLEAQLASRVGDLVSARMHTLDAIKLKSNYTEALLFLSQIDIAENKTKDAIATTKAIISLEPNNPARYYQLGVLESVDNNQAGAQEAFKQAVALNPSYANARYNLAILYAQAGDAAKAIEQLAVVLELNPGNEIVIKLIEQLKSGVPFKQIQQGEGQIPEPQTVTSEGETVTTTEIPDTSLVTPVNTVGNQEQKGPTTTDAQ